MTNILKTIADFLKFIFQSSNNNINNASIKINQNNNSGTITNDIAMKPTPEKDGEDFTINFDKPQL